MTCDPWTAQMQVPPASTGKHLNMVCMEFGIKRKWFGLESDSHLRKRALAILYGIQSMSQNPTMTLRKSKGGGFMASCTHQTKDGPVQVAGFASTRIIAIAKCLETRRMLAKKDKHQ